MGLPVTASGTAFAGTVPKSRLGARPDSGRRRAAAQAGGEGSVSLADQRPCLPIALLTRQDPSKWSIDLL